MGLPAKWTDAEHGLCLSLWAAVTYLQEQGVSVAVEKHVLSTPIRAKTMR